MQLHPVRYEMKDHNNHHERTYGVIAQDVNLYFLLL
jgi:hypothetical protein